MFEGKIKEQKRKEGKEEKENLRVEKDERGLDDP